MPHSHTPSGTAAAPPKLGPARTERLRLAALPSAPGTARRFTTDLLNAWNLRALAADCGLVVSELVTNSVNHTGRPAPTDYADLYDHTPATIALQLSYTGAILLVEVWDHSEERPVRRHPGAAEESGRGLLLVEALTTAWGHCPAEQGGKVTWACWNTAS
ncbi:ATP-binding protein [Thermomonospora cellulosilytica]|uniref:Anti-sigma regulatory factor (Ser/Thr protein kinase) n=1 Tax=Thermomonospora cellulosilytica TaxID=1411118 RepID=A0A7W3RBU2_9ACTN|nr:ATP-binding protein [Thermomonospora cellulosilytica]MBA9007261.1 anti-sigma regulatory factor (Ser/Thr protein kinase) [Thermomonospora cellulosilytica]